MRKGFLCRGVITGNNDREISSLTITPQWALSHVVTRSGKAGFHRGAVVTQFSEFSLEIDRSCGHNGLLYRIIFYTPFLLLKRQLCSYSF